MTRIIRAAFPVLCALGLTGCFKSDGPLINVFNSVAAIPEGTYAYVDTDKKAKRVVITNNLTVTKMITFDDKGSPNIQNLLMRDAGDGYYIVMDGKYNYGLISVENGKITEYSESDYCDDLQEAIELEGDTLSSYDARSNDADSSSVCTFSTYDGMVRAFQTLDNHGSLGIEHVYYRE